MQRLALRKVMSMAAKKRDDNVRLFTKEQLTLSDKYAPYRDLVEALLENGRVYTIETVDAMIDSYMKGKVI